MRKCISIAVKDIPQERDVSRLMKVLLVACSLLLSLLGEESNFFGKKKSIPLQCFQDIRLLCMSARFK